MIIMALRFVGNVVIDVMIMIVIIFRIINDYVVVGVTVMIS